MLQLSKCINMCSNMLSVFSNNKLRKLIRGADLNLQGCKIHFQKNTVIMI